MPAEQTSLLLRRLADRHLSPGASGTATAEGFAGALSELADRLDLACINHSTRNAAADKEKAERRWRAWERGDRLVRVSTTLLCPPARAEEVAAALDEDAHVLVARLGEGVTAGGTGWEEPPPPPDDPQQRITTAPL
ncbi:hypothetical protein ACWGCW_36155 [Streptomyces sp. NPDC054933]